MVKSLIILKFFAILSIVLAKPSYFKLNAIQKKTSSANTYLGGNKPYYVVEPNKLSKRDSSESLLIDLKNEEIYYAIDLYIGSNKESVTVFIDTGSSEFWVNSASNALCQSESDDSDQSDENAYYRIKREVKEDSNACEPATTLETKFYSSPAQNHTNYYPQATFSFEPSSQDDDFYWEAIEDRMLYINNCTTFGLFDQDESDTFNSSDVVLDIEYADGSSAEGNFGTDNVYFLGGDGEYTEISNVFFGLNTDSDKPIGILGLGFPANESPYQNGGKKYDNFPILLKKQKIIKKIVYSLNLGQNQDNSVLFGAFNANGYETAKGLILLPMTKEQYSTKRGSGPFHISSTLSSLSSSSSSSNENNLIASGLALAIFDTGSTSSILPYYIINSIVVQFGFKYNNQIGNYVIDESLIPENKAFIIFNFQGAEIKVPVIDFTFPVIDGQSITRTNLRVLSVSSSEDDSFVLGDDFLSNAYLVVDMEDETLAIGQISNSSGEDIIIVENEIQGATKASLWDYSYGYDGITKLELATVVNPNTISIMPTTTEILEFYQAGYDAMINY